MDDVEVDHGGGDVGVAEEGLDGADVGSGFEEVCGKGVAEGVGGDAFGDSGFAGGLADLPGHGVFMEVEAGDFGGGGVGGEDGGGEEPLPEPVVAGARGVAEGLGGQMDVAGTCGGVLEVFLA